MGQEDTKTDEVLRLEHALQQTNQLLDDARGENTELQAQYGRLQVDYGLQHDVNEGQLVEIARLTGLITAAAANAQGGARSSSQLMWQALIGRVDSPSP